MSSDFIFIVTSWFLRNVRVNPYFNTQWGGNDPPNPGSDSTEITSFSSLFFLGYCCIMQVRFCLCLESRIVHSILKKILKRYKKTRKITGINISNIWIYLVEQIKKWWHDVKNFLTFQIIHFLSWQLSFMWLPFQKISWINHVFCSLILLKLNSNHDLTLCKSIY